MANTIKSINLDLIIEGNGVKPTIPTNKYAVFGDPDFDNTINLMVGQKAYNVTDDIWYYRSKTGIKILPVVTTNVIVEKVTKVEVVYVESADLEPDYPNDVENRFGAFVYGSNNLIVTVQTVDLLKHQFIIGNASDILSKSSTAYGISSIASYMSAIFDIPNKTEIALGKIGGVDRLLSTFVKDLSNDLSAYYDFSGQNGWVGCTALMRNTEFIYLFFANVNNSTKPAYIKRYFANGILDESFEIVSTYDECWNVSEWFVSQNIIFYRSPNGWRRILTDGTISYDAILATNTHTSVATVNKIYSSDYNKTVQVFDGIHGSFIKQLFDATQGYHPIAIAGDYLYLLKYNPSAVNWFDQAYGVARMTLSNETIDAVYGVKNFDEVIGIGRTNNYFVYKTWLFILCGSMIDYNGDLNLPMSKMYIVDLTTGNLLPKQNIFVSRFGGALQSYFKFENKLFFRFPDGWKQFDEAYVSTDNLWLTLNDRMTNAFVKSNGYNAWFQHIAYDDGILIANAQYLSNPGAGFTVGINDMFLQNYKAFGIETLEAKIGEQQGIIETLQTNLSDLLARVAILEGA